MFKLTAVTMYCNGKKITKFVMLPTEKMMRGGMMDIKSRMPSASFEKMMAECGAQRGDTVSYG